MPWARHLQVALLEQFVGTHSLRTGSWQGPLNGSCCSPASGMQWLSMLPLVPRVLLSVFRGVQVE